MADQTQPWAERTVEVPPDIDHPAEAPAYQRGVAQVKPRAPRSTRQEQEPVAPHEPTGTGWPDQPPPPPRTPLGQQLRRGREWTVLGVLFAFVCWGIWALSDGGNLFGPALTFVVSLIVAAGLFSLSRLVGRLVLEQQLGRIRRSARGSHLITGLFLIGVGFAYLRQTEWVVDTWGWIKGFL
jgi:hypothetical protein